MKRPIFILGGLLTVQLVIAAALDMGGPNHAAFKVQEPLLAFDAGKIDRIDIDESATNSVELAKKNGNWTVASMSDFPANGAVVEAFLRNLAAVKKGLPVATSNEARERFKVTDAVHERRIVLKAGGQAVGEILLGSSPTFRQTHASTGSDGNVYSVTFGIYDATARGADWMNRDYLKTPEDQIASISVGGVTIERKDKKLVLSGLADGDKPVESEIGKLALAASNPSFDSVEGKGEQALAKLREPDAQLIIKRNDGQTLTYSYKKEAQGGGYLFASSAHDFVFKTDEAAAEPIVKAKREKFIEAKKPAVEAKKPVDADKPANEAAKAEAPAGNLSAQAKKPEMEPNKPAAEEPKGTAAQADKAGTEAKKPDMEASQPGEEPKGTAAQADKAGTEAKKPDVDASKPGEEPKKTEAQTEKPSTDAKNPDAPAGTEAATKHQDSVGSGG
jgi:hypothetical protein